MKNEYICHMYGNFSKANMDTQTSSHMLLKNNSTEALNQILFPARERVIFEHLVFYYILLYCVYTTSTAGLGRQVRRTWWEVEGTVQQYIVEH